MANVKCHTVSYLTFSKVVVNYGFKLSLHGKPAKENVQHSRHSENTYLQGVSYSFIGF
jgi:hypothetical protein